MCGIDAYMSIHRSDRPDLTALLTKRPMPTTQYSIFNVGWDLDLTITVLPEDECFEVT